LRLATTLAEDIDGGAASAIHGSEVVHTTTLPTGGTREPSALEDEIDVQSTTPDPSAVAELGNRRPDHVSDHACLGRLSYRAPRDFTKAKRTSRPRADSLADLGLE
jgi:hypothetical protein